MVDTERKSSLNRRSAVELLRERVERRDDAARDALTADRRRVHGRIVRGDPTRTERP